MNRFYFISIVLLFVHSTYGQVKTNQDSAQLKEPIIKVALLGTGTPQPLMERFGPSILVQAGGENLLFDAGRGCLQRLRLLDLPYDKLTAIFFTHLHSDHIVGFPDLWLTGWLLSHRTTPLNVFGPVGTDQMIESLQKAYAYDISIRISDDHASPEGSKLLVREIHEGIIYEKNGVKVVAFDVDHFPIVPAFGYMVEYKGHSVTLSGDTRFSENLIKYANKTDLLIHEVVIAPDTLSKSDPRYSILAHHTTPEQAGTVFSKARPKLAAYSHIVKLNGHNEQELIMRTRTNYQGPVIIGEDLMIFSITDTISVAPWQRK